VTTLKPINPNGIVRATACSRPPTGVPSRTRRATGSIGRRTRPQERRAGTRRRPAGSGIHIGFTLQPYQDHGLFTLSGMTRAKARPHGGAP
jgi:hypothetical protein